MPALILSQVVSLQGVLQIGTPPFVNCIVFWPVLENLGFKLQNSGLVFAVTTIQSLLMLLVRLGQTSFLLQEQSGMSLEQLTSMTL